MYNIKMDVFLNMDQFYVSFCIVFFGSECVCVHASNLPLIGHTT